MTTDVKIEVTEEFEEKEGNTMVAAARRVLLAGIGAIALAQDEIEDFVNRLVERGEIAERDGRRLVSDIMERRKKQMEEVGDELEDKIEDVLVRMKVPSKSDISSLSKKITELTKKVETLTKQQ